MLDPAAQTVIINSGDGLKTLDAVGGPGGGSGGGRTAIRPTLAAFEAYEASLADRLAS